MQTPTRGRTCAVLLAFSLASACTCPETPDPVQPPPSAETFTRISERVDPWVARPRVVVMTDIANEPDDQVSMVRLLVYANQLDIEGLISTTSTWTRARVRPDVIKQVLAAYAQMHPTLTQHAEGVPAWPPGRVSVATFYVPGRRQRPPRANGTD